MASPTTSWNLVRVYGTWRTMNGDLRAGAYKITVPGRITNRTDDAIIPAGVFASGPLQTTVTSSPSLDILVPSTDDPDNEQGNWNLQIEVTFTDAAGEKYSIPIPYADRPTADGGTGNGVNLRTVALSAQMPQTVAMYRVGVPGGLAQYNDLGQIVDANGDPVSVDTSGITPADIGAQPAGDYATNAALTAGLSGKVPTARTVAGKPLSADVTLAASDVGAAPSAHTHTASQVSDFTTAVDARVQNVVGAAPAALDTLNEIATALGDDADFAGTMTTQLAGKVPTSRTVAGQALTGNVTAAAITSALTAATTSAQGAVELATTAETTTGTDTTRAVTPAGVAAAIDAAGTGTAVSDRVMYGSAWPGTRPADGGKPLQFDDTAYALTQGVDTAGPSVGLLQVGDYWWTYTYGA